MREVCNAQEEMGLFYSQKCKNVDMLFWGILAKNTNEECFFKSDFNIYVITSFAPSTLSR